MDRLIGSGFQDGLLHNCHQQMGAQMDCWLACHRLEMPKSLKCLKCTKIENCKETGKWFVKILRRQFAPKILRSERRLIRCASAI